MQALAPTGQLRAALYLGGPASVIKDPNSGELRGVGYELGRNIARRLGVPYEPMIYPTPGLVVEDAASGKWDIAFIAQNPDREKIMNYSTAYLKVEHGYLVLLRHKFRFAVLWWRQHGHRGRVPTIA